MYPLLRPLLFQLDAEHAHEMLKTVTSKVMHIPGAPKILHAIYTFENPLLAVTLFGKVFKNPVGLAAGFDKNAEMVSLLEHIGFGFAEFGTVTSEPQNGNPKPRLFRLPQDHAIINRMGFNGNGANIMAEHLSSLPPSPMIKMINIGKNKIVENKDATQNYLDTFQLLFPFMDMCVVNVSSPNTPGLRELQDKKALTEILSAMVHYKNQQNASDFPILVKIAPDLSENQLFDVLTVVKEVGVNGIVATNTTLERTPTLHSRHKHETGGLSGLPLQKRSTQVIRFLFKQSSGTVPIIGVGGIFTAHDAYEKIQAGASLLEIYTGLVYKGPSIVKKINKGLVQLLKQDGYPSIQQAVGKNVNL